MVFEHLTEAEAKALYEKFLAEGMDTDTAFNEIYSIDCNMDEE